MGSESCNLLAGFPAFNGRIFKTATRNNGNLRAGLASGLSFEHFAGRRTSLSKQESCESIIFYCGTDKRQHL